jgi:hypothetical protein
MRVAPAAFAVVAIGALTPAAVAQNSTVARTGVYFESYSFGPGLAFDRISELTIPVTITQRFGNRLTLDLGTAYASASVEETNGNTLEYSGPIDTDVRATIGVIPGRLVFTLVGTLPTGAKAVSDTTIPLFGATATDLLGFTTPGFGSGGGISAGFASAFKLRGSWAVGTGASYRYGATYTPVEGGGELIPGGEVRARFGIEGPFGGGKYFRGAFVYTTSAPNDIGGGQESAIGDRALLYAAVSMPLGRSNLSFYAWDMRRARARNHDSPGVVSVPRGNVLAVGARMERPLSARLTFVPLLELRHELTGPIDKMELLGYLVRTGGDVRFRLGNSAVAVFQAHLAFGKLQDQGTSVSLLGPRVGALLEWSR